MTEPGLGQAPAERVRALLESPPEDLGAAHAALGDLEEIVRVRRAVLCARLAVVCGRPTARWLTRGLGAVSSRDVPLAEMLARLDQYGCGDEGRAIVEHSRLIACARAAWRPLCELVGNVCEYLAHEGAGQTDVSEEAARVRAAAQGMTTALRRRLADTLSAAETERILRALHDPDRPDAPRTVIATMPGDCRSLAVGVSRAHWLLVAVADPAAARMTGSFGWSELALTAYLTHHRARPAAAFTTLAEELTALATADIDTAVTCAQALRAVCEQRACRPAHGDVQVARRARQLAISLECRRYDQRAGAPRRRLLDRYHLQERLALLHPGVWGAALTASRDEAFGLFVQAGLITLRDQLAAA